MKALRIFIAAFLALIHFQAFSRSISSEGRREVHSFERPGRPTLRKGVIVLFPFTLLSQNGGRYTFYEPANQFRIFDNGDVEYQRVTRFGNVEMRGKLSAEDFLMPLSTKKMDGFQLNQTVCLRSHSIDLAAGTPVQIQRFYEKGFVLAKSSDLFHALEGRRFAFPTYELGRCR